MNKITIGPCTLYHGDALKIMPTLKPVDLVVTDPPYKLTSGGKTAGGLHERFGGGGSYDNSGQIVPCDITWPDFMRLFYDVLKPRTHAYVMCNNRNIRDMLNAAYDADFEFHNFLIWHKRSKTPNRWYMKSCEFGGFFYKPPAKMINNPSSDQFASMPQVDVSAKFSADGRSSHPTEKPVLLMKHWIENSTLPDEVVLDPFMGSGTTGISALRSGRRFIGIEKDDKFFKMAARRIEQALKVEDYTRLLV